MPDRQRLARAYEVLRATGRPLASWQAERTEALERDAFTIFLDPPRAALYARCDARFRSMLAAGALEEVRGLPAVKAHGVPELQAALRGELSLEAAIAKAQQNTRNYAKRQRTWFRRQQESNLVIGDAIWTKEEGWIEAEIFSKIREFLLTRVAMADSLPRFTGAGGTKR